MKFRALLTSTREGIQGIIRHPLVTLASYTTILLMLLLMSVFLLFSANARYITKRVSQQPPVEVYMKLESTQAERDVVVSFLEQNTQWVMEYEQRSPEQNYLWFRENLGDSASILDNFDYMTYLPYTFHIRLVDPTFADEVDMHMRATPGVNKVLMESRVMDFLTMAGRWVNIGTFASFSVLLLIAMFIISNMVRISVYSRATEISIMKFVGATSGYIRLPYIIEGLFVGMASAVSAWAISYFTYVRIFDMMMTNVTTTSFYALLPIQSLSKWVMIMCLLTGMLIGGFGSAVSVRKYIKV
ncbi:MAG TPA: ABC transporter permease [Clostridiaceae bacterium]|jgi:cell division transport system permease protein|nr:ABC transporter permease [Clostridiaceae bacterium]